MKNTDEKPIPTDETDTPGSFDDDEEDWWMTDEDDGFFEDEWFSDDDPDAPVPVKKSDPPPAPVENSAPSPTKTRSVTVDPMEAAWTRYREKRFRLGRKHPETLKALADVAKEYCYDGDYEKELELEEEIWEGWREIRGERDPSTLIALHELATTCICADEAERAYELCKQLYPMMCEVFDESHLLSLEALVNLIGLCGYFGYDEEYDQYQQIHIRLTGEKYLNTI